MQLQCSIWAEHKYISHVTYWKRLCHLRAHGTLIEIYCSKTILLEVHGSVARWDRDLVTDHHFYVDEANGKLLR